MSNIPDRFYISDDCRNYYNELDNEKFFKGRTRKEQFLYVMGLGFKNNYNLPIGGKKDGIFFTKDLRIEDEALISAVGVASTGDVNILADKARLFKIAEEYANGGIRLLIDKINQSSFGSFEKQLEKDLVDLYNRIFQDVTL